MQYAKIPTIDKPTAKFVMGTMIFTLSEDVSGEVLEKKTKTESFSLLDEALELGYNTFDTARVYAEGRAELCIGLWMQDRDIREKIFIIGKGGNTGIYFKTNTPEVLIRDIYESCDRLRTNYIDLYLVHRDNPAIPIEEVIDVLAEMHGKGYIKGYGGSNWELARIIRGQEYAKEKNYPPLLAMQPGYSLAAPGVPAWGPTDEHLNDPACKANYDYYKETKMAIFTWSSMARGFWSGLFDRENFEQMKNKIDPVCVKSYCHEDNFKRMDRVKLLSKKLGISIPNIALAYILNQPLNIHPVIGCTCREDMISNLEALEVKLDKDTCAWLNLERDDYE